MNRRTTAKTLLAAVVPPHFRTDPGLRLEPTKTSSSIVPAGTGGGADQMAHSRSRSSPSTT